MDSNKRNSNGNGHGVDESNSGQSKRHRVSSSSLSQQEDLLVECIDLSFDSEQSRSDTEICSDDETAKDFPDPDTPDPSVPSCSRNHDSGLAASSGPDSESDEDDGESFLDSLKKNSTAPSPGELFGPKYDMKDDSFILVQPGISSNVFEKYENPDGIVPVIVDPDVAENLRPDQKAGIEFMFNNYNKGQGCLLAHEMGVGKTLSCIALVHTLLHQSVNSPRHYRPSLSKVVIVCPKTLVAMWDGEFEKWLKTEDRPKVVRTVCKPKEDEDTIKGFLGSNRNHIVLIISYEVIKKHERYFLLSDSVNEEDDWRLEAPLDLIIFDEVHRLKNHKSQLSKACHRLKFNVKIGLTGTPIQNTLEELCRLVDIVQPNTLLEGTNCTEAEFDEHYTKRFSAGNLTKRSYVLTNEDKEKLNKLKSIIGPILHIRQNKVSVPKYEMIVCGRLTELQRKLYKQITNTLGNEENKDKKTFWYTSVTLLRNICHHPLFARRMLRSTEHKTMKHLLQRPVDEICKHYQKSIDTAKEPFLSQKLKFICGLVFELLEKFKTDKVTTNAKLPDKERVVIVSNSTEVLAKVEKALKDGLGIKCLSITGKTKEKDRTSNCKRFNDLTEDNPVFLLSSKAGGVGITLTGGNHLVMLDPDWNPANDEQAMARIWREGQTKPCYIYRLFATGTVEEVMFKRQLSKKELDRYITDKDFTKFEILPEGARELFVYDPDTLSSIHDSIKCTKDECPRPRPQVASQMALPNSQPEPSSSTAAVPISGFRDYALEVDEECEGDERVEIESDISSLAKWAHFVRKDQLPQGDDELPILRKLWNYKRKCDVGITFVFYKKTDTKNIVPIEDPSDLIDFLVSPGSVSARQVDI